MPPSAKRAHAVIARMAFGDAGVQWHIAEMREAPSAGAAPSQCLVLSSANRCVRLWSNPSDWRRVSVEQRWALKRVERDVPTASLNTSLTTCAVPLMTPQSIEPGTAIPNMGVTDGQARDMSAYLYTLH